MVKWSCPTTAAAKALEDSLITLWMGRSKAVSPYFPGWYVGMTLYRTGTTVRQVFHVEPEALLPQC